MMMSSQTEGLCLTEEMRPQFFLLFSYTSRSYTGWSCDAQSAHHALGPHDHVHGDNSTVPKLSKKISQRLKPTKKEVHTYHERSSLRSQCYIYLGRCPDLPRYPDNKAERAIPTIIAPTHAPRTPHARPTHAPRTPHARLRHPLQTHNSVSLRYPL